MLAVMRIGWTISWLAFIASPVFAQDGGRASERALSPLIECRKAPDLRVRAACYDSALARLQQAIAARQLVILDREEARSGSDALLAARRTPADAAQIVNATITAATSLGNDMWAIRISTGAIWRTIESNSRVIPRTGIDVRISPGVFGSHFMRIGKTSSVRVVRVE